MIKSYNELYLPDAMRSLGYCFDYAMNDLKYSVEYFEHVFRCSSYTKQFEIGNPSIISGRSGIELAADILQLDEIKNVVFKHDKTKEFFAGYYLAYYQWYSGRTFDEIFYYVPLKEIINMHNIYHEMDLLNFVDDMEEKINNFPFKSKLKRIRQNNKLSQAELAKASGVKLRSIQLYEQGVNDIDKAQAHTLYKLAKVLHCDISDLLQNAIVEK